MQTTLVLKDQLQIPDQIWQTYPLYLEITDESQDQFNIHHQSSMNIYDIKVAYAVKVVFQLLLDQNIQLLNELLLEAQKSKNQKYVDTIETIEFAVYQLNKEDPHFYLGTILNNKQISKYKLNSEQNITASSIYSFVLNTKLYDFFDEIKLHKKIPNQCITNKHFNSNTQIVLYQTKEYAFVLIQRNEKQIEKHIQDQHQIFLKTIGLQLIQPSTRQNLAEKLKNQPYKMNSYQEFCKLLELDESQCSKEDLQKFFDEYVKGKSSITDIQNKLAEAIINIKQLKAQQSNRNFYYNYLLKNPRKHATNPQEQITQTTKIFINEDWFDVYVSPNQNIDQIISSLQQQGRIQQQIASVDLIDQNGYLEAKFYLMELLQFIPIQNFQLRIHCLNQLIDQTKRLTLTALNFNWKEQNESDKVYKIPFEPSLNMVQISEMINSNIYEQFTKIKFFKGEPLELIPELLTLEYFQIDENTMIFVEIICQIQQEQQQQQQQSQEQEQQEQQYQLQLQQQQERQKQHDQHQEDQYESPTVLQDEVVNEQPPKDKEIHFSSLKIIPIQQTQIIKNTERFQRINPHIQQQQSEIAQNYQNNLFVFKEFSILIDCNSGSFLVYKFKNIEGVLRKENGKEIKHECKQFQPLSHQIEIAILKYGFLVKWEPNKFNSIIFKRNG